MNPSISSNSNSPAEHETTRMSVCLRLAVTLAALGSLVGGVGMAGVANAAIWGGITLGVGVGLLFSSGIVGLDAYSSRGVQRASIVRDE